MYIHLLERFSQKKLIVCGAGLRYGVAYAALEELSQEIFKIPYGVGDLPDLFKNQMIETSRPIEYQGICEGDIIDGRVINIAEFGIFVNISNGLDGLIHKSNYNNHIDIENLNRGMTIKVKVQSIKPDRNKPNKMKIDLRPIA